MRNVVAVSCALFALAPVAAVAAGEIGFSQRVQRNAVAELGAERRELGEGVRVRTDEFLVTDAFGRLTVQFFDRTLLSIGPASRVKLDRFVVKADGTASSVVFNAVKGAFRFATGTSDSRVYRINTPAATMGVRGTRFAFEVDGQSLRVSVSEGAVQVCPRTSGSAACRMARPGSDVLVANRRASVGDVGQIARLAPVLGAPLSSMLEPRGVLRPARDPLGSDGVLTPLPSRAPDISPSLPSPSLPGRIGGNPSLPAGGLLRR